MAPWHLLDPKEEENLHKTRLLNVEERPFLRITKRMQTAHSLAKWGKPAQQQNGASTSQPTSPTMTTLQPNGGKQPDPGVAAELASLREDVTLDFAAFDFTIARFQSLLNANAEERARYGADRQTILDQCQAVRDSTAALRARLDEARATLEQRRRFDDLADRITSNRSLRPRAEQNHALAKLEDECAQLEAESAQYAATWRERRDQFARIMEESMRLRRQIRDEADEVDRREGMGDDDAGNDQAGAEVEGQTPRPGIASGNATPMPHVTGGSGCASGSGVVLPPRVLAGLAADAADPPSSLSRPASTFGGRTSARGSPAPQEMLKPRPDAAGSFSQSGSRPQSQDGTAAAASAVGTPAAEDAEASGKGKRDPTTAGEEDVEMSDVDEAVSGSAVATTVGGDASRHNDSQTTAGTPQPGEKMDTT